MLSIRCFCFILCNLFSTGLGNENRKRRDDSQFDIDDVIIPCNSRSGRLVEIQYKEIMTPRYLKY